MATPITPIGLDPVSSLCTSKQPANVLTGIFTRLLREHFSDPNNLEFGGQNEPTRQLEQYLWSSGPDSHIQIQPVWAYNTQDIQNRPALYIKRNAFQPQRIALDNGWGVNSHQNAGKVVEVRGEFHGKTLVGSHTIFCVGREGAEAELLGQEVLNHFMMFGPLLRRDLKLMQLEVTEVGEVALLDEFVEHFVVPVVVGYGIGMTWRLKEVGPLLKTLAIDLSAAK